MKLITKSIENAIAKYPLYSQEGKGEAAKVIVKFFHAIANWTWYVLEGEKQENGDYMFFGIIENCYGEREQGYFTMRQLLEIRKWGLGVERDMYFKGCVKDIK